MSEIQVFPFESNHVRVVHRDGVPWWVADDVCGVLGMQRPLDVVSRLGNDQRVEVGMADATGREQQIAVINESGLDTLIQSCPRTEASLHLETVRRLVAVEVRQREQERDLDRLSILLGATFPHMSLGDWAEAYDIVLSDAEVARGDEFLEGFCRKEGLSVQKEAGGTNAYPLAALAEWLEMYRQPVL